MEYNKKNQAFTKEGFFRIKEVEGIVEYCRVKFFETGNQLVFPHNVVKSLDFEDIIVVEEEIHRKAQIEITNEDDLKLEISEPQSATEPTVVVIVTPKIIATNPKGDEVVIIVSELEAFCDENDLDLEAVQSVLDGKQKTHKKWKFTV